LTKRYTIRKPSQKTNNIIRLWQTRRRTNSQRNEKIPEISAIRLLDEVEEIYGHKEREERYSIPVNAERLSAMNIADSLFA